MAKGQKGIRKLDKVRRSKRKKEWNAMSKKCPHCEREMRPRGASNSAGSRSWKCSNGKCGRTVWVHTIPKPPVPLVPIQKRYGG